MQNITKRNAFVRSYQNMRGINSVPKGDETDSFCFLENMYVDYEGGGGAVESIPGFRRIFSFEEPIHLIFSVGQYLIVHAGEHLYNIKKEARDNIPALHPIASIRSTKSRAIACGRTVLILDGEKIISVSESGEICEINSPSEIAECNLGAVHGGDIILASCIKDCKGVFLSKTAREGVLDYKDCSFDFPDDALSMISAYGYLWVFTPNSVIGYKKSEGVFREEIKLGGISPTGEACMFYNELIFVDKSGIYAIQANDEVKLAPRSAAINPMLLNEDLSSACLSLWRGYLVVSIDGRVYLADSRDKVKIGNCEQYRWYFLNGIGTYRADKQVYRYSEAAPEGFSVYENPEEKVEGEIMSLQNENHEKLYFVWSDEKKYSVYPTDELEGGVFFPATCVYQTDDLLFFGTECGDLCLFNSDMRGKAPKRLAESADFNLMEYEAATKGKIHPDFYSFAGHAPRYALLTPRDTCNLPFDKKSDLPFSLVLTLKSFPKSTITVEERYDGSKFLTVKRISNSQFNFYDFNFGITGASADDCTTVKIPHRRVGWTEKQIAIYSKEYCSPFGVYSISFAYKTNKAKKHSKKGK